MVGFANAKINLGLQVKRKRSDGFHDIESVFYPIPLYDAVEIVPNKNIDPGELIFHPSGLKIPGSHQDNLCIQAYNLLNKAFTLPGIDLFLHKTIPFGAGLGGGSSDAIQVLVLLNRIFQLNLTHDQLVEFAQKLGSDCPFFLLNKPCLATGRGERLEKLSLNLQGYHLVLIKPDFGISTKEAFRHVIPEENHLSLKKIILEPVSNWKETVFNDFEKGYQQNFPQIEDLKNELYAIGALYASMSGSGSCVYGIFKSPFKKTNLKRIKEKKPEFVIYDWLL